MMEIARVLKRDISSQFKISRNLKEGVFLRFCRVFWVLVFLLKAFRVGVASIRREQLGSEVIYKGRRMFISNWAGSEYPTLASDGFYKKDCDRSQIKNVINFREILHRFTFGVSFYTSNWIGIDVNKRLYSPRSRVKSE